MKAREAPVTREHLFDKNARVPGAEEVDKPIACNRLRAPLGGTFDVVHLGRFYTI
jgi:hypothetical protein